MKEIEYRQIVRRCIAVIYYTVTRPMGSFQRQKEFSHLLGVSEQEDRKCEDCALSQFTDKRGQ